MARVDQVEYIIFSQFLGFSRHLQAEAAFQAMHGDPAFGLMLRHAGTGLHHEEHQPEIRGLYQNLGGVPLGPRLSRS